MTKMWRWIFLVSFAVGCADAPADEDVSASDPGGGGKADTTIGPVVAIGCKAVEPFVRRGGFTAIEVDARDAEGGQSRNYEVTVQPELGTQVIQRNKVVFDNDGSYQVTCCARDADLCDQTAVQVGRLAPALSVEAPRFVAGDSVWIEGRTLTRFGKVPVLTVNGRRVAVEGDGRFGLDIAVESGPNTVTLVASDAEGETSTRYLWLLAGPFVSLGEPRPDTAQVLLGPSAYADFADVMRDAFEAYLDSPAFAEALSRTKSGTSVTHEWTLTPTDFAAEEVALELQPHARGVRVEVMLKRPRLGADGRTRFRAGGDWLDRTVEATADRLVLRGLLVVGALSLSLEEVDVELVGLDFEISDLPGFIETILAKIVDDDIVDSILEGIGRTAESKLGGVARGFAHEVPIALPEPLWGELVAGFALTRLEADEEGLHLALSVTADGETDPLRADAPGYWRAKAPAAPVGARVYEAAIGLDAVNSVLFAGWQTGAFDISLAYEEEALRDARDVDVKALDIFFDFKLPPQATMGDRPGELLLHFGGMRADVVYETDLGVAHGALEVGGAVGAGVYIGASGSPR